MTATEAEQCDPRIPRQPPPDLTPAALNRWRKTERDRVAREYTIHDCEVLLTGPDRPDDIAARLGFATTDIAMTMLKRWGRPDLAARFAKTAWDVYAMSQMGVRKGVPRRRAG